MQATAIDSSAFVNKNCGDVVIFAILGLNKRMMYRDILLLVKYCCAAVNSRGGVINRSIGDKTTVVASFPEPEPKTQNRKRKSQPAGQTPTN